MKNKIKLVLSILFIGLLSMTSCQKEECFMVKLTVTERVESGMQGNRISERGCIPVVSDSSIRCGITEHDIKKECKSNSKEYPIGYYVKTVLGGTYTKPTFKEYYYSIIRTEKLTYR